MRLVLVLSVAISGCGLVLDLDPPNRGPDAGPRPCREDADCGDGNACNGTETCSGGVCVEGTGIVCADSIDCTDDACDPATGSCVQTPINERCEEDAFDCTAALCDTRSGCYFSLRHDRCDDSVFCTVDTCSVQAGCSIAANHELCGGPDPFCDTTTGCVGETCVIASDCPTVPCVEVSCTDNRCVRTPIQDGTVCEDTNPCTPTGSCQRGVCVAAESPLCPEPCMLCNSAGGGCDGSLARASNAECEDGSRCTEADHCVGAECTGTSIECTQDPNRCVISTCMDATGCVDGPRTTGSCDDGDRCTLSDACNAVGSCVGDLLACPVDTNACTLDSCDRVLGCTAADGTACATGTCSGGVCGPTACAPGLAVCDNGDCCESPYLCMTGYGCDVCEQGEFICPCDGAPCQRIASTGDPYALCTCDVCAFRGFPCSNGQVCCECFGQASYRCIDPSVEACTCGP